LPHLERNQELSPGIAYLAGRSVPTRIVIPLVQ
jgi:hypothetical protein